MRLASVEGREYSKRRLDSYITLSVFVLLFAAAAFGIVIPFGMIFSVTPGNAIACNAEGDLVFYWAQGDQYSQFPAPSLSINIGFGSLTFTRAKAIDVVWDLMVGRGGQIVHMFIAYPIVRKALSYVQESTPVSFGLFSTVAFDRISTRALIALCTLHRYRWHSKARPARSIFSWIYLALFLVFGYILSYPTVISIMTGYQATQTPYLQDPTDAGSQINTADLIYTSLVVMDGTRVGQSSPWGPEEYDASSEDFNTIDYYYTGLSQLQRAIKNGTYATSAKNTTWVPTEYTYIYGARASESDEVPYQDVGGGPPNCSFSIPPQATSLSQISSTILISNKTWELPAPPLDVMNNYNATTGAMLYLFAGNSSFNQSWYEQNILCEAQNTYQWGFSFYVLCCFVGATWIYASILVTLQWVVHNHSRADRIKQPISVYRDVLDLAQELKDQLGEKCLSMPGDQLDAEVRTTGLDLSLDMSALPMSRKQEGKQRRKDRRQDKKRQAQEKVGQTSAGHGWVSRPNGVHGLTGLFRYEPYTSVGAGNTSYEDIKNEVAGDAVELQDLYADTNHLLSRQTR